MVPNAAFVETVRRTGRSGSPRSLRETRRQKGKSEGGSELQQNRDRLRIERESHRPLDSGRDYVKSFRVQQGLSDGIYTEVQGEGLTEGMKVVVGIQTQTNGNEDVATNPFTPKFPPRGGTAKPK